MGNPLLDILGNTAISTILKSDKVIFLTSESTIAQFLALTEQHQIISVPILKDNQVLGVVGLMDIVRFLVSKIPSGIELSPDNLTNLAASGVELSGVQLKDILALQKQTKYLPTLEINPLSYMMEVFASGVHRACVFRDSEQQKLSICSQTDIIRVLQANIEANQDAQELAKTSLLALGLAGRPPVAVLDSLSMVQAFQKMVQDNVRCLVVVDESGQAVGNISSSDLKGNFAHISSEFSLSVREFLAKHRPCSLELRPLKMNDTLGAVIQYLIFEQRHRCWIIDDSGAPVGLVTMTDIIRLVHSYQFVKDETKYAIGLPAELCIRILEARNLMVGDIVSSDPYVVVNVPGRDSYRTKTVGSTLNPKWTGEVVACRLERKDALGTIVLKVMDEDLVTQDDFLGQVKLDIAWMLNGFGTFQYLPVYEEWFHVDNAQKRGQLRLSISVSEISE